MKNWTANIIIKKIFPKLTIPCNHDNMPRIKYSMVGSQSLATFQCAKCGYTEVRIADE